MRSSGLGRREWCALGPRGEERWDARVGGPASDPGHGACTTTPKSEYRTRKTGDQEMESIERTGVPGYNPGAREGGEGRGSARSGNREERQIRPPGHASPGPDLERVVSLFTGCTGSMSGYYSRNLFHDLFIFRFSHFLLGTSGGPAEPCTQQPHLAGAMGGISHGETSPGGNIGGRRRSHGSQGPGGPCFPRIIIP